MRHGVSEGLNARGDRQDERAAGRRSSPDFTCSRPTSARGADDSFAGRGKNRSLRSLCRGQTLKPMLAFPVDDIAEAFATLGPDLSLEHKLDGARVQIHHADNGGVRIFSRRLNEITESISRRGRVVESNRIASRDPRRRSDRRRRVRAAGLHFQDLIAVRPHPRRREKRRRSAAETLRVRRARTRRRRSRSIVHGLTESRMLEELQASAVSKSSNELSSPTSVAQKNFTLTPVTAGYEGRDGEVARERVHAGAPPVADGCKIKPRARSTW